MTTTMMVAIGITILLVGNACFFLGAAYSSRSSAVKVHNMKVKVDRVIHLLQIQLITDNDHRGFHTRTQVVEWLKRVGPSVHEEFHAGVNNGRKTI